LVPQYHDQDISLVGTASRRTLESLAGFVASRATFPISQILLRLVWILWTCLLTTLSGRGFSALLVIPLHIDYQEVLYRLNASDMDGLRWKTYQHLSAYGDYMVQVIYTGPMRSPRGVCYFSSTSRRRHLSIQYHQNLWSRFELASLLPISN